MAWWLTRPAARNNATQRSAISARFTASRLSTILPDVNRDTSSRSSTRRESVLVWRPTIANSASACSSAMPPPASTRIELLIAPIGFLSSCPSIARNSSFARFAASASALAVRSAS
jgi:hypothetical protein